MPNLIQDRLKTQHTMPGIDGHDEIVSSTLCSIVEKAKKRRMSLEIDFTVWRSQRPNGHRLSQNCVVHTR